jgi:nucleotide-binding universal stress UspA family protein
MGFEKILVPLDGGDLNEATLETALAAAQRFKAHIEVLYIRTNPEDMVRQATARLSDSLRQAVLEAATRSADERPHTVQKVFESFFHKHKIAITDNPTGAARVSAEWHEETGYSSDILVRRGRLSDLILLAHPGDSLPAAQTFETALLETGRPVLIVPAAAQKCIASRITIGWNASAEAARAVAEALPCLTSADRVTILASEKRNASARELADYLKWHGIKPAVNIFEAGSRSVGETLLEESRALDADLLVIGGYTHTRARQLLFGGVTRHLFEAADIPVMMAH